MYFLGNGIVQCRQLKERPCSSLPTVIFSLSAEYIDIAANVLPVFAQSTPIKVDRDS